MSIIPYEFKNLSSTISPTLKILLDMEYLDLDLKIKLLEIASTHSGGCFKILKHNYRELVDLMTASL